MRKSLKIAVISCSTESLKSIELCSIWKLHYGEDLVLEVGLIIPHSYQADAGLRQFLWLEYIILAPGLRITLRRTKPIANEEEHTVIATSNNKRNTITSSVIFGKSAKLSQ